MFDSGMKYVRIGQYEDTSDQTGWDWVEQKKGQLSLNKKVDDYVDSLVENGATIELQLLYGNPMYTSPAGVLPVTTEATPASVHNADRGLYSIFWPPQTPDQVAAFMRYAKYMVRHFKGHIQYYSLWNEEDITYWNPYPDPEAYGRLLSEFVKMLRETDPNAKVVFGGLAGRDPDYARKALDACNCADQLDVFAYHAYPGGFSSNTPPERMDSTADGNRTSVGLREAVTAYPGIQKDLRFWNDEYNSVTGHTPAMDESLQAKYVPRAIVYNWERHIPTFLWELINDTNTSEGNDFGIINGKLLKPTDFQPKPVFFTIERTNALFADTVPDPTIGISVPDARSLETTSQAPFFSYGFRSQNGKSVVAYWLGSKGSIAHASQPVYVQMALQNSGIAHPILIDLNADTVIPIRWETSATGQVLRVPVRDSVMAIADASYFDWAVLPEVPGGLIAQPTGGGVDLKWQETRDASRIIVEARSGPSSRWGEVARVPASATSYQVKGPRLASHTSFRICAVNQAGRSAYSNLAYVGEGR